MQPDGPVTLYAAGSGPYQATCVNGLVLLAKINGNTGNWAYNSALWTSSAATLNPTSLAFDLNEAKLKAYSQLPIQGLRVGMSNMDGSSLNWIDVPLGESFASLEAAMAEGTLVTHAGRSAWTSLFTNDGSSALSDFSGEPYCITEGINTYCAGYNMKLGLLMNNDKDCWSCDIGLGFGISIYGASESSGYVDQYNTWKTVPKFGYILGFSGK